MTIDKERLRVLAEGATPGPWGTIERGPFWGESEGDVIDHYGADVVGAEHVAPLGTQETTRGQMWLRDAEFIAAARDAVPALLAENAALAAEVERLRKDAGRVDAYIKFMRDNAFNPELHAHETRDLLETCKRLEEWRSGIND